MWRRKSRFPHGRVDTVRVDFSLSSTTCSISWRVDSGVSIAMPPVCERRLVVHAAVDAVDRCLELVANEPRAHSGSLTLEMAIGGRCDRRRELVAPNSSVDWFLFPHVGAEYPRSDSRPDRGGRFQHSPARSFRKERNSTSSERPSSRDDVRHRRRNRDDTSHRGRSRWGTRLGRPPSTARTDNGSSTGSRLRRLAVRTDVMEWQSSTASVRVSTSTALTASS